MQISELAEQLRERQRIKAQTEGGIYVIAANVAETLPDEAVVDSYITCAHCQTKEVSSARLNVLISQAHCTDSFFNLLDAEHKSHAH